MANPLLGQILGGIFGNAMRGRARSGPFGTTKGAGGGGLGDLLGGMMGGALGSGRGGIGGRGALVAMLLPFAMQWVQRNGGIGGVLERFKQKGYRQQADSWISTGPNQMLQADAIDNVVGREELSQLARQFGVPEQEVADGFAEILPEMVDQLSPEGQILPEADEALDAGQSELDRMLAELRSGSHA